MKRQAPYDDYIMEHIRSARNYRLLDGATHELKAANPMCGDELSLQLRIAGGKVEDAAFQCECCGVSMASASMMTEWVGGRTLQEALRASGELIARLSARDGGGTDSEMEAALAATVRDHPARARCALFPWNTLRALLETQEKQ